MQRVDKATKAVVDARRVGRRVDVGVAGPHVDRGAADLADAGCVGDHARHVDVGREVVRRADRGPGSPAGGRRAPTRRRSRAPAARRAATAIMPAPCAVKRHQPAARDRLALERAGHAPVEGVLALRLFRPSAMAGSIDARAVPAPTLRSGAGGQRGAPRRAARPPRRVLRRARAPLRPRDPATRRRPPRRHPRPTRRRRAPCLPRRAPGRTREMTSASSVTAARSPRAASRSSPSAYRRSPASSARSGSSGRSTRPCRSAAGSPRRSPRRAARSRRRGRRRAGRRRRARRAARSAPAALGDDAATRPPVLAERGGERFASALMRSRRTRRPRPRACA